MLTPDKHTDVKYSVLYISGLIKHELTKNRITKYDDLKKCIINQIGQEIGDIYEYSLSFLFLLDEIHYQKQTDTLSL